MGMVERLSGGASCRGVRDLAMAKRFRVTQVIVPLEHDSDHVRKKACRIAGIRPEEVRHFEIVRQAIDARKKGDLKYSYTVDLVTDRGVRCREGDPRVREVTPARYAPHVTGTAGLRAPIAVVGTGPAGLFCALLLAENGYRPLIFERGRQVEERLLDVERFWSSGKLDPGSNVQFGEGGAGTFSDGKLNTNVRDRQGRGRFVLETLVRFGAPADILYAAMPHIGTDLLCRVVANMREEIIRLGGRFCFSTEILDIEIGIDADAEKPGLIALAAGHTGKEQCGGHAHTEPGGPQRVEVAAAVFAIGHSARDTFAMLRGRGVRMEPKPFAVGMRVEHPQAQIDRCQYGEEARRCISCADTGGSRDAESGGREFLPAASYKLTCRASNGRSVYSFCMCPGGYVVNASSEEGRTAVNGMSDRARDAANANSAIIVSVTPEDFPDQKDALSGIAFQRELEERAFAAGMGRIPQQRFGAYAGEDTDHAGTDTDQAGTDREPFSSCAKGETVWTDLRDIFPREIREAFVEGMHAFSHTIPGFDREDAILSAVESRTSSPVRITRDDLYESNISGLYPCGEGAGYAGGIMSAAMDGLRVAEALLARFAPPDKETDL